MVIYFFLNLPKKNYQSHLFGVTTMKEIGITRDAYKLTSLKGDTYQKYFAGHLYPL